MPEVPMSTHGSGSFSRYEEHGVQSNKTVIEGNKTVATGRPSVMLHRPLSTSMVKASGASCEGIKHPDIRKETPKNDQRRSSHASQLCSPSRHGEDMENDRANDRDMANDQRNQFGPNGGNVQPEQVDEPMRIKKPRRPMTIEEREQAAENSAILNLPNFHQTSIEVAIASEG